MLHPRLEPSVSCVALQPMPRERGCLGLFLQRLKSTAYLTRSLRLVLYRKIIHEHIAAGASDSAEIVLLRRNHLPVARNLHLWLHHAVIENDAAILVSA